MCSGWKKYAIGVVYFITNKINGGLYIGCTFSPNIRFYRHTYDLRCGKHVNKIMQADYNEYGEEAFEIEIHTAELSKTGFYTEEYYENKHKLFNLERQLILSLNPKYNIHKYYADPSKKAFELYG